MSVLSRWTVTPNRIEIVYRYVRARADGDARDDLMAILSPPALGSAEPGAEEPSTIVVETLGEARAFGLLAEDGDGRLVVPDAVRERAGRDLLPWLEGVLTDPERAATAGQSAFPYALAWFLTQDPARPLNLAENQRPRIDEQCGPEAGGFDLSTRERFQNFVYWGRYLGYAWRLKGPRGTEVVLPDPTEALARHLPSLLEARRLPIEEFVQALAARVPVFEGGAARERVESSSAEAWRRPSRCLSASTSLGLHRLEQRGLIGFEYTSDAPSMDLASWPTVRPISHVVLKWRGGVE